MMHYSLAVVRGCNGVLRRVVRSWGALLVVWVGAIGGAEPPAPVRVFLLAGQSNMEGKAKMSLVEYQATHEPTQALFAHWRKDGRWLERDDVWIKFLDRRGTLTVGYGSPNCIGPELECGAVLGDRYEQPVLLIKTAWGGRSLYRDFRPPSAGLPPPAVLDKLLAEARSRAEAKPNAAAPPPTMDDVRQSFGTAYREMLDEVRQTLARLQEHFPEYAGQGYELSGMVWLQGWNDMIQPDYTAEYTDNLAHFIRDVRRDLQAPQLPFVIGQMGVDGLRPNASVQRFKDAQARVLELPEFQKNVALVKTDAFWDTEAEAVFKKGWREHLEEWNTVGSDYGYHYYGSAKTMLRMGRAFAEALLELRGERP
jgi:alpha-galactosidase